MPSLFDLPAQALAKAQRLADRGSAELHYLAKMIESGAFRLEPPQKNLIGMVADIRRWGGEIGMVPALNARRTPNKAAIVDDEGSMTFKELDDAANAVANALLAKGVTGGDGGGGHPGPEPPLVRDRELRRGTGRRPDDHAQHGVLRAADPGRVRA